MAMPLVVAILLLLANGFFVGAEFGLIAARRSKIEQLAEGGDRKAKLALRSVRELSFMLAGAQLGITMASLGLGAIAEPAVARLIESGLHGVIHVTPGVLHTISFVIALSIVVFLHMVVGEMAPKNIAIAKPEGTALWVAAPFRFYTTLFRPFIHLLNGLANGGVRLLGVEPQEEARSVHTSDEIGLMIAESARGGAIDKFEHRLLQGAIQFSERDAASVMVPRTDVIAVPLDVTPEELEKVIVESGHSRLPVYAEDLDHVVGFFHAKDLLKVRDDERQRPLARRLIRQMLVVPESRHLHPLLLDMRRERRHFALVVEEHGGTAGIVTLEDLLEELVGEIRDEHDAGELGIVHLDEGRYCIPGVLRIDEAERVLGIDLPEGEYETVAGFLMDKLGRIPKRRDRVSHDGWRLTVSSMQRRRVEQVIVERAERVEHQGR
ncbi:MAG: hemolysin family protein [Actinomycetota bacterium]|nr:hemolysin family protein [Actinomycetota bacterium]